MCGRLKSDYTVNCIDRHAWVDPGTPVQLLPILLVLLHSIGATLNCLPTFLASSGMRQVVCSEFTS